MCCLLVDSAQALVELTVGLRVVPCGSWLLPGMASAGSAAMRMLHSTFLYHKQRSQLYMQMLC